MEKRLVNGILLLSWMILHYLNRCNIIMYLNFYSGGGSYDEKGDEIKIGKWIELCDYFTTGF